MAEQPNANYTQINGKWFVVDPEDPKACWITNKTPSAFNDTINKASTAGGSVTGNSKFLFVTANLLNSSVNSNGLSLNSEVKVGVLQGSTNFEFDLGQYNLTLTAGGSLFTLGYKAQVDVTPTKVGGKIGLSPGIAGGEIGVTVNKK